MNGTHRHPTKKRRFLATLLRAGEGICSFLYESAAERTKSVEPDEYRNDRSPENGEGAMTVRSAPQAESGRRDLKAGGEVPSAEIVEDRKSEEVANGPDGERKCATDPPQTARQTSAECTDRPQVGVEPTALVQPVAIEISLTRALRDVVKRYVDGGELEKAQKVLELLADIEGEEAKAKADNGKVVSLDAARKAGRK